MSTSTPTAPPPGSIEARLLALEQKLAPLVAGQVPGKLSTRAAGFLTALAAGITYVVSSGFLSPEIAAGATVVIGGISAFVTAEET
jgi:hypothetical protein